MERGEGAKTYAHTLEVVSGHTYFHHPALFDSDSVPCRELFLCGPIVSVCPVRPAGRTKQHKQCVTVRRLCRKGSLRGAHREEGWCCGQTTYTHMHNRQLLLPLFKTRFAPTKGSFWIYACAWVLGGIYFTKETKFKRHARAPKNLLCCAASTLCLAAGKNTNTKGTFPFSLPLR